MLKKLAISSIYMLLCFSAIQAEGDVIQDVTVQAEQLKEEINLLNVELVQQISQEVSEEKIDKVTEKLNKLKLKEETVQKFLGNQDISENLKSKIIKKIDKVKDRLAQEVKTNVFPENLENDTN